MKIIYILTIINTIFLQRIHTIELLSTCSPSLTRPGRPLPCSSNLDCECLNLASDSTGICASTLISCSSLSRCDLNDNKTCSIPNTICVVSSRCNQPVCYPIPLANPLICPTNSTVIPSISSTTVPSTTSTTTPYQIRTTYQISGAFNIVILTGIKFVAKFVQLFGSNTTPYIEILNTTTAPSPISINNVTQTLTLSNLNNVNITLYFKTLRQVVCDDYSNQLAIIDIGNLDSTDILLGTFQQANITGTNQLNVYPGCCGVTNISSLGTINVMLTSGGWPNVAAIGENVYSQGSGGGVPRISIKARNNAGITTGGITTAYVEAGNSMNISTGGISTVYGQSSSSTLSVNIALSGISTVYMGVSNANGTKTGYSCPKTVDINIPAASTVYVCATNKINVNGWGGDIYYQGPINDTRTYGSRTPF